MSAGNGPENPSKKIAPSERNAIKLLKHAFEMKSITIEDAKKELGIDATDFVEIGKLFLDPTPTKSDATEISAATKKFEITERAFFQYLEYDAMASAEVHARRANCHAIGAILIAVAAIAINVVVAWVSWDKPVSIAEDQVVFAPGPLKIDNEQLERLTSPLKIHKSHLKLMTAPLVIQEAQFEKLAGAVTLSQTQFDELRAAASFDESHLADIEALLEKLVTASGSRRLP